MTERLGKGVHFPVDIPKNWLCELHFRDEFAADCPLQRRVNELSVVSKTPPSRRATSAAAAETRAVAMSRGRGRPPRAAATKSAARKPSVPSLGERVLALATGRTRQELYLACPSDRPNHVGIAVQRHLRAGRIQERDGKLYAISPAT